jgi:hypothetical protein
VFILEAVKTGAVVCIRLVGANCPISAWSRLAFIDVLFTVIQLETTSTNAEVSVQAILTSCPVLTGDGSAFVLFFTDCAVAGIFITNMTSANVTNFAVFCCTHVLASGMLSAIILCADTDIDRYVTVLSRPSFYAVTCVCIYTFYA